MLCYDLFYQWNTIVQRSQNPTDPSHEFHGTITKIQQLLETLNLKQTDINLQLRD